MFLLPDDVKDPQVDNVFHKTARKWGQLPAKTRQKFVKANLKRLIRRFTSSVVFSMEAAAEWTLSSKSYWDLVDAIRHALGRDIVIEMVGSRTRRTAAIQDNDMDLQVRRDPSSERRDEPFTNIDMQKVARNLEMLNSVTSPVVVGNVAIKFRVENNIAVDLVLWRPRKEQFPKLRGGDDFYENSARINEFLEQTPAARAAIIGVKQLMFDDRPKGILLEAIAWRLAETCPFPLTRTAREYTGSEDEIWTLQLECFKFFLHVFNTLKDWKASPFGSDLKEDLALLPERKQEEHLQRFEKLRRSSKDCTFGILVTDVLRTAKEKWTQQDGPWHLYLERELVEFFPFDEKRASRLSKKRKNSAPIVSGRTQAPRSPTEPRGFAQTPAS